MITFIKLLEQKMLTEGRIQDVLKKYEGKVSPEIVYQLSDAQDKIDPKINNKYLDWMVKQYINGNSIDDIIKGIEVWHKNLDKIDAELIAHTFPKHVDNFDFQKIIKSPKNINVYPNLQILSRIGTEAQLQLSKAEEEKIARSETQLVYEDERYKVLVPLTHRASRKYGRGTSWCTAFPIDKYFKSHTKNHILFYIIDKTLASQIDNPLYKIAVLMNKENGAVQIWNASNRIIGYDLSKFFPTDMIKAMKKYQSELLENISHKLTVQLGKLNDEIYGWRLTTDGKYAFLIRDPYKIKILIAVEHKYIYLEKYANNIYFANTALTISDEIIKEIEIERSDIVNDEFKLIQWSEKFLDLIKQNWGKIMHIFFAPYGSQMKKF